MKQTELELVIKILTYSAWFLGGCLLLIGLFVIVRYWRITKSSNMKEIFFKDRERPNGKPKITNGKF